MPKNVFEKQRGRAAVRRRYIFLTPAAQVPELQKHRYFTREESVLCAELLPTFVGTKVG